jgi:SNF family Na+-dependent transporter
MHKTPITSGEVVSILPQTLVKSEAITFHMTAQKAAAHINEYFGLETTSDRAWYWGIGFITPLAILFVTYYIISSFIPG